MSPQKQAVYRYCLEHLNRGNNAKAFNQQDFDRWYKRDKGGNANAWMFGTRIADVFIRKSKQSLNNS